MDAKPSSIDESKSDGPLGTFTWLATLILSNDEMYSRLRIIDDEYYRYYGLPIHILKGYSITIEDKAEWDKQFLDHVIEDYTYGFYGGYGIGHYPAYHHYGGLYDDDIIDLGHGAAMNALTGEVIERDMIADVEYATEMYELGLDPYDKEDTEWYYTNFYHYVLERDHRERSDFYEPL